MNFPETLLAILEEAFDRPPTSWAYFTDGNGESSYFGTLNTIDFDDARRCVAGNSIAAQTQHVIFVIRVATESISGNANAPDAEQWRQSWSIDNLDSETWDQLRHDLRNGYSELRRSIRDTSVSDDGTFATIVGMLAHVAYHLGAIRCKVQAIAQASAENLG